MHLDSLVDKALAYAPAPWTRLLPGLGVACSVAPRQLEASFYEPMCCLILQGAKEATIGNRTVRVSAGESVIVSHHLPVTARILEASPEVPYLALVATLDLAELLSVYEQVAHELPPAAAGSSYEVTRADPATVEVLGRAIDLAGDPTDARVLLPMVRRELHYRLLRAENSGMVRSLLSGPSHAHQVSRAIQTLRAEYRDRLEVEALALSVGMSPSSFYKHFKAVTATTPLQYQKDLRLTEARRLLARGAHTVSSAAYEVGYESPSQFSREYSRRFGAAPSRDVGREL